MWQRPCLPALPISGSYSITYSASTEIVPGHALTRCTDVSLDAKVCITIIGDEVMRWGFSTTPYLPFFSYASCALWYDWYAMVMNTIIFTSFPAGLVFIPINNIGSLPFLCSRLVSPKNQKADKSATTADIIDKDDCRIRGGLCMISISIGPQGHSILLTQTVQTWTGYPTDDREWVIIRLVFVLIGYGRIYTSIALYLLFFRR